MKVTGNHQFIVNGHVLKSRFSHLAISGSTSDVGGKIFDTRSRKTTSESKMLIPRVTLDNQ